MDGLLCLQIKMNPRFTSFTKGAKGYYRLDRVLLWKKKKIS